MVLKVGIIIPCYRASGLIKGVVVEILNAARVLGEKYNINIYLVDDCCPEKSWKEVTENNLIKIINHTNNKGVGASTITGFKAALLDKCDAFVKLDADGQHNPLYLKELIPYIFSLPDYKLVLIKGTRYFSPTVAKGVPLIRRFGSLFLEPIARTALSYRKLTDVSNGYLALNANTLKHLLSRRLGAKLQYRYLFESSILEKCCQLNCEIHEFAMASKYGKEWKTSLKSINIIIPLVNFWVKAIIKRIANNYFFTLNLGSVLLFISSTLLAFSIRLFIIRIYKEISAGILVSAGTSAAFTSSITLSLITFCLFLLYDYNSGLVVKKIRFKSLIDDLNENNF